MVTTLLPGFVQKLFTKKIQVKSRKWEKENGNYTQSVSDALDGAVTANLYNAQKNILQKVLGDAKNMENALKSLNNAQDIANQIIIALADIFSFILPFLVGAIFMFNGQIGAGTLVMIVQLSNNFINPIVNIFVQLNQIKSTKPILEKLEPGLQYVGLEGKNKTKQPLHFNNLCVKNF
ncbi:ABC superfamily ATP binding cassette transporter, ABC and permease protein [Lactobacillus helveticus DSM 20075 = CGMCC 1.1877]|nr:ABC superfamily ATP binding cassette transporter, ABC and permease protein [Lactobacillus helveticus DSM 20075 = CGMCC 1.1877]